MIILCADRVFNMQKSAQTIDINTCFERTCVSFKDQQCRTQMPTAVRIKVNLDSNPESFGLHQTQIAAVSFHPQTPSEQSEQKPIKLISGSTGHDTEHDSA
jgi:hypothetical protein